MHKSHRSSLSSILTAFAFLFPMFLAALPAGAIQIRDNFQPGYFPVCYSEATANQTFATTSYADLAVATCTLTPTRNDPTTAGNTAARADLIEVTYSGQGSKATATTGICGVFVNGAVLAATERITDFGEVQGVIGGTFIIPNTTVGVQTIKMQCKSGDTNIFTVKNLQLTVREIVRY